MAMNKARRTANLNNILTYDTLGNSTLIANLTVEGLTGAGFVKADAAGLLSVDTAAYTVVTGATNYLTKITAPNTLGQSLVYDNGTSVYINTAVGVPGYSHAFQVMANGAGGLVVSTTDVASAIGIVNSSSANKTWDISPFGNHLVINESGVATRMKFDAGGNITIGDITNSGHKLEVVGSFRTTGTNTLSALQGVGDRMVVVNTNGVLTTQPIPTGSITGTGAAGQVNFWTGTNTVSGSNNLFWDNTNGRLGIGTNAPISRIETFNNSLYVAGAFSMYSNTTSDESLFYFRRGRGSLASPLIVSTGDVIGSIRFAVQKSTTINDVNTNAKIESVVEANGADLRFHTNNSGIANAISEKLRIYGNGNVLIQNGGTFSDGGQRLQVIGDTLLRGSGATSATTALTVQNSGSTNILFVRNDGNVGIGTNAPERPLHVVGLAKISTGILSPSLSSEGSVLTIGGSSSRIETTPSAPDGYAWNFLGGTQNRTSGDLGSFRTIHIFAPTSGTSTYNGILLANTINQTGGANGITRGLYVNPTLTAAADFRAIETTAGNVLFGSNFFWDATNSRLGIGTNTPANDLSIVKTSAAAGEVGIYLRNLTASGSAFNAIYNDVNESGAFQIFGSTFAATSFRNTLSVVSTTANGIAFLANSNNANAHIKFVTTTSLTERMRIVNSTGNIILQNGGTFSDGGQRLQVYGDTLLRGSGNTNTTTALTVQNSASTNLLRINNAGEFLIAAGSATIFPSDKTTFALNTADSGITFYDGSQTVGTCIRITGNNITGVGGQSFAFRVQRNYVPASGNGTFVGIGIESTINQVGATGVTRGLYINPTLTAAADWRSIEWSNNSGWGLYGAGTANNYLNGSLLIGSATDDTVNKLQVTGTIVAGSGSSTTGSVILRGSYTVGYLTILGTDASSGGPMLSYGIQSAQNSTAGAFVSSSGITIPRSAYVQNGGHIWYTAPSSSTAIGTAVVPTKHMELYNSGNLVLGGGADDAVNRLQVGGNAFIKGTGNTSATTALTVQNSSSTNLFRVRNDGNTFTNAGCYIGTSNANTIIPSDANNSFSASGLNLNILFGSFETAGFGVSIQGFNSGTRSATSGASGTLNVAHGFAPTSGTGTYTMLNIVGTINQTGGANGVTRGLLVSPTLTAAADWRSIEWLNNTGWGLYGVGTAKNYLNGTTLIGTTTDDGINKLQVAGSIASTGIMRSDAARTAATNDVSIALLGSNITTYTAGFTMGAAGYGLNAVYAQHEQRFGGNATFDAGNLNGAGLMLNRLAPTAAGTITMNQQAGRIRTMSNLHLQTQIQGNNNITVTHMSGLHIYGHYRTTGTITLTVGDYYGILLADPNEFSTGPTITGTNWGFYQQGAAPINAFEGSMLVGTTTTDANNRLVVSGNTRVTGNMTAAQLRLSALNTAPATSTSAGTTGEIRIDADNIYVCTATNTWKRAAIATF